MESDDRPTEREDHEGLAGELDREADRLEHRSRQLDEEIGDVRDDWEAKRADPGVPGAPPRPGEDDAADRPEDTASEDAEDEDEAADDPSSGDR